MDGNTLCAPGYDGIACASCAFSYFRLGTVCKKCLPTYLKWMIVVFSSLLIVGIIWRLRRNISKIPYSVRIATTWFQMFSLFPLLSRKWPQSILSLFSVSKFVSFDLQYFGFECDVSVGYWFVWAVKLSAPLILFLIPMTLVLVTRTLAVQTWATAVEVQKWLIAFVFFLNLFYTSIFGAILEPFNCVLQGDGLYYMMANPSQKCFDSSWNAKIPSAIFFVIVYVFVFPVLSLWAYISGRRSPDKLCFSILTHLLTPYRKEAQLWEWFKLAYKLMFVVVRDLGLFSQATRQTLAVCLIMAMLCADLICAPFSRRSVNLMSVL
eukprot:TRINITY_DN10780_c0_g1_i1.p1 TRINITY_DN10780_c0_g1~~TRINITY_DN10780_c0_g1_i1.p1  ORF type:complete len:352 (-),score=62.54 TRINITY_DN10780_c0_g1_i1:48-1013(-)